MRRWLPLVAAAVAVAAAALALNLALLDRSSADDPVGKLSPRAPITRPTATTGPTATAPTATDGEDGRGRGSDEDD
ncbi:MAG: hypothetical protein ACM33B_16045 [Pseudomonadota bacterium]